MSPFWSIPKTLLSYRSLFEYNLGVKKSINKGHIFRKDVVCYVSVEYLSFIVAMSRNHRYDYKMIKYIVRFVRRNIVDIVTSDMDLKYRISALLCAVNYKLLIAGYRLYTTK